jgi:hypothetical protein
VETIGLIAIGDVFDAELLQRQIAALQPATKFITRMNTHWENAEAVILFVGQVSFALARASLIPPRLLSRTLVVWQEGCKRNKDPYERLGLHNFSEKQDMAKKFLELLNVELHPPIH